MERTSPLWGLDSSHPSPERGVRKSSRTGSSLPNRELGAEPALPLLARGVALAGHPQPAGSETRDIAAARSRRSPCPLAGQILYETPRLPSQTRSVASGSSKDGAQDPPAEAGNGAGVKPRRFGAARDGQAGIRAAQEAWPARALEVEARAGPRGPRGSRGVPARDPAALTAEQQQQQQQPKLRAPPLSRLHGRMAAARGRLRPGWVRGGRRGTRPRVGRRRARP